MQLFDGGPRGWPNGVCNRDDACQAPIDRHVDDGAAGALESVGLGLQFVHGHALRGHQQAVAQMHPAPAHPTHRALAVDIGVIGGAIRDRPGVLENRLCQRVLGMRLHGGRNLDQARLVPVRRRHGIHHVGLSHRQGASLVENHHVEPGALLDGLGMFEQDAVAGPKARANHDRHGRREAQRIRAGNHEHRNGQGQGEQQRLAEPPKPHGKRQHADHDRRQHQPLRGAVGQELRRRLGVLGSLYQLDDLGECGIRADLGGAVGEGAAAVDGAANHQSARRLLHRHRLAGEHRFVDLGLAFEYLTIDRHLGAWTHDDHLAYLDVVGGDLHIDIVPAHDRPRWREFE